MNQQNEMEMTEQARLDALDHIGYDINVNIGNFVQEWPDGGRPGGGNPNGPFRDFIDLTEFVGKNVCKEFGREILGKIAAECDLQRANGNSVFMSKGAAIEGVARIYKETFSPVQVDGKDSSIAEAARLAIAVAAREYPEAVPLMIYELSQIGESHDACKTQAEIALTGLRDAYVAPSTPWLGTGFDGPTVSSILAGSQGLISKVGKCMAERAAGGIPAAGLELITRLPEIDPDFKHQNWFGQAADSKLNQKTVENMRRLCGPVVAALTLYYDAYKTSIGRRHFESILESVGLSAEAPAVDTAARKRPQPIDSGLGL